MFNFELFLRSPYLIQIHFQSAVLVFKVIPLLFCCLKLLLAQRNFIVELIYAELSLLKLFDLLLNLLLITLLLLILEFYSALKLILLVP
jgi:hypothetical protein